VKSEIGKLEKYWTAENKILERKGCFDYASKLMFEKQLTDLHEAKILDVGCGLGMSKDFFLERKSSYNGIDLCFESLKDLKAAKGIVAKADARKIPFADNSFDIVYSLGVVEHFKETETSVREHVRVCKPGGTVIVVVPNRFTPYVIAGHLYYLLRWKNRTNMMISYGKTYTRNSIKSKLIDAGCQKEVTVGAYYGSAALRVFPTVNNKLVDLIEKSFFSTKFGLVLFAKGIKKQ
jgi:ubiquinone/menaquinone biosynthesis C-methylase UbiE